MVLIPHPFRLLLDQLLGGRSEDHPTVIGSGIDKLNAYFLEPIPATMLGELGHAHDLSIKRVFLKDRKPYLAVGNNSNLIHLKLGQGEFFATALISNPNKFKTWKNYLEFISTIIPKETLLSSQISRLDLNLDFAFTFSDLIQKIDIKNKRSALTFLDESGCRTGMIIGKGNEKIEIYDKAKKEKLMTPFSRIELRLGGNKLPTRSLLLISKAISEGQFFEGLIGLTIRERRSATTAEQSQKLELFKRNLERDGFYSAKKTMNQSRNFDRDFAKLFKIEKWALQPSELFASEIQKFIQPQEDRKWMNLINGQSQAQ